LSKGKLPDYRLKQKILYIDKTPVATLIHYGDLFLEEGALSDALEFYTRGGHQAGLTKIKEIASENGDTFLFNGAARALGIDPRPADWEKIARRAMELKKFSFAKKALEKTNNTELLNALATEIKSEEFKQSA
jgi:hypothetical protein